jgi:glutathione S-transferase
VTTSQLKLYDYVLSGNCYKIRLLLTFLDLPFESIPIDFYPGREHKQPDFLEKNPLGQLPVLEDGQHRQSDAQAILTYLAAKYDTSGQWFPADPVNKGRVVEWLSFAENITATCSAARLHDILGYEIDITAARLGGHRNLQHLDDHLVENEITSDEWLIGVGPTIADVACFPYVALAEDGGISLNNYPAIRRWIVRFKSLPRFIPMPGIPPPHHLVDNAGRRI